MGMRGVHGCVCACLCALLCACARPCVRTRVYVCACVPSSVRSCAFLHFCRKPIFACMCFLRACVCGATVCASCGGWGPLVARRGLAVLIARPTAARDRAGVFAFVPSAVVARVGCRREVAARDRQRAVGCARWAHVRDRRRRRDLRHRRQHRRPLQPLPGRVDEHRRRCATGLGLGLYEGTLGGYSGHTQVATGVVAGYSQVVGRVLRCNWGYSGVLGGYYWVFRGTKG
jgi:hypothetical protein